MDYRKFCKGLQYLGLISSLFLMACSVNPATGQKQFTGLMSADSEASIGAGQHEAIIDEYGGLYKDPSLQNYLSSIGSKIATNTERADVAYKFYLLDSPVVNAFALPGGYIYVTRGLMAVANDEAELAGVLGHEIGHVTARHQAARYSQSVLANLGTTLLGATVGSQALTQALDVGSNLYISSYSREQESEADMLGIRYVSRAGYDPKAVSDFLAAMDRYQNEQSRKTSQSKQADFFATHPQTGSRISAARAEAAKYPAGASRNEDAYLSAIDGMAYGDSLEQGFARGDTFYHPVMGFTFRVPPGYTIKNMPGQIVASRSNGPMIIVDRVSSQSSDPSGYIVSEWLKNTKEVVPEAITINGRRAATASFNTTLNGTPILVRLIAIEWNAGAMFRMQFAIPENATASDIEDLKATTYSFRELQKSEVATLRPEKIRIVPGQQVMAKNSLFYTLNNLNTGETLRPAKRYKTVEE